MNVTLTSLEALILKGTNETLPCPDPAALEAFCAVMRQSPDGPQMAAQTLAARIHVPHTQKALLALAMTDRCMRKCGPEFHAEVGKFRFLNEMIKLVSPKYLADKTAPEVRTRVLQLLHAWSIEFPSEFKFKVAYDMLKNQGVVKETPPPLPPEEGVPKARPKNPLSEDAEKNKLLQKLLQSKKPEDIQHANRLIKTMVREEEKRNEEASQRVQQLSTALDSASLLSDMLDSAHDDSSQEEIQLIHDLYMVVYKMRRVLNDTALDAIDTDCLEEVIKANDIFDDIHRRYVAYITPRKEPEDLPLPPVQFSNLGSLLDFAGARAGGPAESEPKGVAKNAIDELGDIFSSEPACNIAAPMLPVNLMQNEDVDLLAEKPKAEGWNELDSLGEQLLMQSLPDNAKRVDGFNGKTKKTPMNALTSPKREVPPCVSALDLDFFTKKLEEVDKPMKPRQTPTSPVTNDDVMVDITDTIPATSNIPSSILDSTAPKEASAVNAINSPELMNGRDKSKIEVKPLSDINVTLESVHPSNVSPLVVYEERDGLTVVFHFCKDRPRPDVNVVVVSTTSRSGSVIEDYRLQCVVPKGCRVRLLPASSSTLPVFNPFLPPPALTQVMLIARPSPSLPVYLKFVLTYALDDDVYTEMGEVKELPLDEIQYAS